MDKHSERYAPQTPGTSRLIGMLAYAKGHDRTIFHDTAMAHARQDRDNRRFNSHVAEWEKGWDTARAIASEIRLTERIAIYGNTGPKRNYRASPKKT